VAGKRSLQALYAPVLEDGGELMVGDDDVLIDIGDGVDVIKNTVKNRGGTYLEEGFGKVLC